MALISSSIPNMVNGVSQQPFTLRLSSQAELQENGLSTTSQGLRKRPPTKHLKKILNGSIGNAFVHTINRDENERYVVVVTNGDLKVFDLAGNEKTVNFPNGKGYLSATSPDTAFRAVTVADYTFLVNKTITVTPDTLRSPKRLNDALINVKVGNYGKKYAVIINGTELASYTTPDGTAGSHTANISTDFIANQLFSQLASAYAGSSVSVTNVTTQSLSSGLLFTIIPQFYVFFDLPAGRNNTNTIALADGVAKPFSLVDAGTNTYKFDEVFFGTPAVTAFATTGVVNLLGSVIHFTSANNFTIEVRDGFNNGAMNAIKDQIQKFSDLPANAGVDGFAVEVVGDKQNGFDNFWVRFDASGTGTWRETLKPNSLLGYTASTMPHTLVREANGTFTFAPTTWDNREKGTENSNPDPSFVGRKITDLFFYRNRLGFLVDESVVMSEAGEFFNFYRTTVTELLDADPIDVTVSHTKVSSLLHAVPYNKQLLLFSAQTQFTVDSGDLLTPTTISIKQNTEFECTPECEPVGVGNNIYFPVPKGEFSGIREYYTVEEVGGTNDAADITAHVPSYIAGKVFKIAAGLNENILAVLSKNDRSSMWIYKFYWSGQEKIQSSWSKWTLGAGDTILNADFILSDLYMVIQREDGVYLEVLSVAVDDIGLNEPYNIHLDRKLTVAKANMTFDGTYTNIPSAYLPGPLGAHQWEAVVATGQGKPAGIRVPLEATGSGARAKGNYTDSDLVVGRKYLFRYKFSPITVKVQQNNNAQKSDTVGRLQLRNMSVNYSNTGYFKANVTPSGRSTYEYIYTGKTLGLPSATIGEADLETGLFQFPILARNTEVDIEISSDAPLPVSLLSADWEGMYVKRSRTV
jgi:hypothetical protein